MVQKNNNNSLETQNISVKTDTEAAAPKPLSCEQFERIVVLDCLKEMDAEKFKQTFHCEATDENIHNLLRNIAKLPASFITSCQKKLADNFKLMQNFALEGKPEISWYLAESYASFTPDELQYISDKSVGQPDMRPYIKTRFSEISSIMLTLDFVETVETANAISATASSAVSMKNADKIYNKLRYYEPNLEDEQKASIYFLSSELFRRAQIVPGIYHEPKPCDKEIFCLRMVLESTSESGMVDCCLNRLSAHDNIFKKNIPYLILAYKKVLEKQHTIFPEDNYRLNTQIAQLYQKSMGNSCIAFSGLNSQQISALNWAEYYYRQAALNAPTNIKKSEALLSISNIQLTLGFKEKARKTSQKAVALLPEPDCFEKMLDLAAQNAEIGIPFIKKTIRKIQKATLPAGIKKILYGKALQVTHQKSSDTRVISSVEKLLPNKKLTPNNKIVRNISTHE